MHDIVVMVLLLLATRACVKINMIQAKLHCHMRWIVFDAYCSMRPENKDKAVLTESSLP